jgi:hypothetical protein
MRVIAKDRNAIFFTEDIPMQKIPITEARNKYMKLPDQAAKDQILAITFFLQK